MVSRTEPLFFLEISIVMTIVVMLMNLESQYLDLWKNQIHPILLGWEHISVMCFNMVHELAIALAENDLKLDFSILTLPKVEKIQCIFF